MAVEVAAELDIGDVNYVGSWLGAKLLSTGMQRGARINLESLESNSETAWPLTAREAQLSYRDAPPIELLPPSRLGS